MRVIGGTAKGRLIRAPRGLGTRPTSGRVRKTLFDVLGQRCDGWVVLDLFAGSGSLGLEALSRGASRCVFVESSRNVTRTLRRNIEHLGFAPKAMVEHGDALALERWAAHGPFHLVLADPPYRRGLSDLLGGIDELGSRLLEPGARVVLEHDRREDTPSELVALAAIDSRRFGDTMLSFFRYEED